MQTSISVVLHKQNINISSSISVILHALSTEVSSVLYSPSTTVSTILYSPKMNIDSVLEKNIQNTFDVNTDLLYETSYPLDFSILVDNPGVSVYQEAPLSFFNYQRVTYLAPELWVPDVSLETIFQKSVNLVNDIDVQLVSGFVYTKSTTLDTFLDITGPVTSLETKLSKSIESTTSIDVELANPIFIYSDIDTILSSRRYKVPKLDTILQTKYSISNSLDVITELLAIYAGIDVITTPTIIGERDIHEFNGTIHTMEERTSKVTTILQSSADIVRELDANLNIETLLDKETQI